MATSSDRILISWPSNQIVIVRTTTEYYNPIFPPPPPPPRHCILPNPAPAPNPHPLLHSAHPHCADSVPPRCHNHHSHPHGRSHDERRLRCCSFQHCCCCYRHCLSHLDARCQVGDDQFWRNPWLSELICGRCCHHVSHNHISIDEPVIHSQLRKISASVKL